MYEGRKKQNKQRWRRRINLLIVIGLLFNILLISYSLISENFKDHLYKDENKQETFLVDTENSVHQAINFLRDTSIFYSDREDEFEDLVLQIEAQLENNPEIENMIPYLSHLAYIAGGKHGYIRTTDQNSLAHEEINIQRTAKVNNTPEAPKVEVIDEIMYINIPSNSGSILSSNTHELITDYLESPLQEICDQIDDIKGVVIDLANNRGGRPELMIALVAPFLEKKILFSKVYSDGQRIDYDLLGDEFIRYFHQVSIDPEEYMIANKVELPIAVVVNNNTTSAGEWTLLSILSQKDQRAVRVFGQATGNAANEVKALQFHPNYVIVTAAAELELPNGIRYGKEPIQPDEYYFSHNQARNKAKEWIQNQ